MSPSEVRQVYNLFGCRNPTGAAFLELVDKDQCIVWGRDSSSVYGVNHVFCDLSFPSIPDNIPSLHGVVISFSPIWLFTSFLELMAKDSPHRLKDVKGIIACSSSSYITKKYAFNRKDKELVASLSRAHDSLFLLCRDFNIPCQILAPTMVYGLISGFQDKNISQIIRFLRRSPLILLPQNPGKRQPIHASQLAEVAFKQASSMISCDWTSSAPLILNLGGDEILSYKEMIYRLKYMLEQHEGVRYCKVVEIPVGLYDFISAVILPFNPTLFEALMRVKVNLSDFIKANTITGRPPKKFPVTPLTGA